MSEEMALQEDIHNERLAEPLRNAALQSNRHNVSELDDESWKKTLYSGCI